MKHAPAYVLAHDLVVALHGLPPRPALDRAVAAAHELLEAIALALTFPDGRAASLYRADAALVRVRVSLRVAAALGAEVTRPLDDLLPLGRMIGGWRKELRRQRREGDTQTASSAAGPTTTPPRGAALPGATGTTRGGAGTTRASACSSPPPPATDLP